ncbi:MAG: hypothetical protein QOI57_3444, partial [Rubrobacteraceae bacterium]|nr:hypothetical protein [Rubrobacteraceae bacterium]
SREKVLGGLQIGRILFIRIGDNLGYLEIGMLFRPFLKNLGPSEKLLINT